jgi:transcriptional regulator with XRE-family HTH domain
MTELEKAFGGALRELRNQRGLSQESLGFEAELARNYISQLELGNKSPSLRTIFKLCKVLEVNPASILEEVERRMQTPKRARNPRQAG